MEATIAELGARARLERIFEWYQGMVVPSTGRLAYVHEPARGELVAEGEPIREIAAVHDLGRLGRYLGRTELRPVVERSVRHWARFIVERGGASFVDTWPVGEPPGIAHAAFLILGLLETPESPLRDARIRGLAEGLLRQQRADGSLRVWFELRPDDGVEFYPGEALLALLHVHERLGDPRCLAAAERGFGYFRRHHPPEAVAADLRVFQANWQSQYGARLHRATRSYPLRAQVRAYLYALHDRVLADGFYEAVATRPDWQATVQVACGLEGIVEACILAEAEGDGARADRYAHAGRIARDFLFRAQRLRACTERERGGFGHGLSDRTQRIDVTGHAANGLMRAMEAGLG